MVRFITRMSFGFFAIVCLTAPGGGAKCGGSAGRANSPAAPTRQTQGSAVPARPAPTAALGDKIAKVTIGAVTATRVIAVTIADVQLARAATLYVEQKQLEIEIQKKNGDKTNEKAQLTDEQVDKIKKDMKVSVKCDDGSENEIPVTIR
jgi:hypothetical protein